MSSELKPTILAAGPSVVWARRRESKHVTDDYKIVNVSFRQCVIIPKARV